VGAEEYSVNMATDFPQFTLHFAMDRIQRVYIQQPSGQAGLVSGDHHPAARLIEVRNRLQAPWNGDPLFRRLNERFGILVDNAIPI
jgi:hypothetical protein